MALSFIKMHGIGNDFVILDARKNGLKLSPPQIRRLCDRHQGIGCDQLIVLEKPGSVQARLAMRIYNADGSSSSACGNAARCVARLEKESGAPDIFGIETDSALLSAEVKDGRITIDMGKAHTEWQKIPLARATDTDAMDIGAAHGLPPAMGVNIGNPHAVFFVPDVDRIDVAGIGPKLEHDPLFPERANIEFATVQDKNTIRMRVWERGAGITQACGSGACAVLVAAARKGLTGRKAVILLDGGALTVTWLENNHVLLEGPASYSFSGTIPDELLQAG